MRSKAHWHYDATFTSAMDAALRPTENDVERWPFYLLEVDDTIVGFFAFGIIEGERFLTDLFVDPPHIGRGIGGILWTHAIDIARSLACTSFLIESDPNAEGFYSAMGARRIGSRVSLDSGRELPLLRFTLP